MYKTLLAATFAALLATPVLAETVPNLPFGSDEPQSQIQWDDLVAKANAYRHNMGTARHAHGASGADAARDVGTASAPAKLATPVLAETVPDLPFGSDEPQSQIQWDNLVAKANAYRHDMGTAMHAHGASGADAARDVGTASAPAKATTSFTVGHNK